MNTSSAQGTRRGERLTGHAPQSRSIDICALRSFIAIADNGGFRRAAEVLNLSQSGVSQHVRKLERMMGGPVVQRDGRDTSFTPRGEALLNEARCVLATHDEALGRLGIMEPESVLRVGSTEHAADQILLAVTRTLVDRFPGSTVRFRIDGSDRLNRAVDLGSLDVAIFVGDISASDLVAAGSLPLSWYAAPDWERPVGNRPLPLVAVYGACTIRRLALRTLASHDLHSEVVVDAGHVGGVLNAARAGLGVALLADLGSVPEGLERRDDLPAVEAEDLHVRVRRGADPDLGISTARAVSDLVGLCSVSLSGSG